MAANMRQSWGWLALCLLLPACQQEMAKQPKYLPYQESNFWGDGRSARPLVQGTVARGQLRDDVHLFQGRRTSHEQQASRAASLIVNPNPIAALGVTELERSLDVGTYITKFPLPKTEAVLRRGQERYNIYCAVCHDQRGTGNGIVVQRGYTRPPSLTAPVLVDGQWRNDLSRGFRTRGIDLPIRDAPVGYYYEVITNGLGSMPDYATQVPPHDRWAIIAYLGALQRSQNVQVADLPQDQQRVIREGIERDRARRPPAR